MGRPHKFTWPDTPPDTDECWLWPYAVDSGGYGFFTLGGRHVRAHRHAYQKYVGAIPDGGHIDHACHNVAIQAGECSPGVCTHRRCMNPRHLRVATAEENVRAALPPTCRKCGAAKERRVPCSVCRNEYMRQRWHSNPARNKKGACPVCGKEVVTRYLRDHYGRVHPEVKPPPLKATRRKLTDDDVRKARADMAAGASIRSTAKKYGVTRAYMSDINNNLVRKEGEE